MDVWLILSDVVLLLAGALIVGTVFSKIGQSPLVGYLLAGMLLGGSGGFQLIKSEQEIHAIAELGIALLLFSLGLEFSTARLRRLGTKVLMAGVLQIVLTLSVCSVAASILGFGATESFAIGAMFSLSSTAVVLRILMEKGEIDSPYGRNSLAVLLVQDIAVIPLAFAIGIIGGGGASPEGSAFPDVWKLLGYASSLVLGLYVLLNFVAVRALKTMSLERNRELSIILAAATGLGSAWAAHAVGISPALGAFIAGLFLGGSPFATQVRADIAPLRVVLLTLFFASAGMVADPVWILKHAPLVLATTLGLFLIKFLIVWGIFQALRQPAAIAITTGMCLSQVGEFAFVLGNLANAAGMLGPETLTLAVSVTITSLFCAPFILARAPALGQTFAALIPGAQRSPDAAGESDTPKPDVIIIGFGPTGQIAADVFAKAGIETSIVDLNPEGADKARELGFQGCVGDATKLEVLEHAGIASARAVVITIPHRAAASAIVNTVRRLAPAAHVVVRSRYHRDRHDLAFAGAHAVFGDEEEIGNRLGKHLEQWLLTHRR